MARFVGACPSCDSALVVRRLECPSCGVGVDGRFDAGPLARLNREQLSFVETFLRARGKIKDVEEELGISYPTVVARLNDVLIALGFEAGEDPRDGERRQRVLDELSAGRLSAAEAAEQLRSLGARDG
ncbi:MAG: DUF2089 domain-containing protein [Dehalococcoidia bacterium]|mgnify:CR=1 FL=1|jgi:hypothetical protein|uniref:DUF2089 domain-containing protein n=1 Tax=Candidatus Amarobacter glycogenicus TaxID=3140699 RepID=UPI001E038426|nr:DUF2089 domain-containing protein [Dehalococcoidia bacterium]MBK7126025.1 DUF2089 domain-containing protein [Dehalococcoidia bacterium]MBK7329069.1 DUF2089 domain-containing protein [Dehalococcoidia bacterium]MBK7726743.1 DUF2089 domain-containing protein [Dehalococcoidia bacterium]MBK8560165.1 DUF2089 domain-containing protein [Dehalococcoidia bacterium]